MVRYNITSDDVDLLRFLKLTRSVEGVEPRYQKAVKKLEASTNIGETLEILGNLQTNIHVGSCDLDMRIAEVVCMQVHEYLQTKQGTVYRADPGSQYLLSPN